MCLLASALLCSAPREVWGRESSNLCDHSDVLTILSRL